MAIITKKFISTRISKYDSRSVIPGQVFGRLTVVCEAPLERRSKSEPNAKMWECHCTCGTTYYVTGHSLKRGATKSCGCLNEEMAHTRAKTHGLSGTGTYYSWASMKDRCVNPNTAAFKYYGARGITVCERWISFENFLADMGERPSDKHSIDRLNNDKGYYKENCRWATKQQQLANRRTTIYIDYHGKKMLLSDCCKLKGLNYGVMRHRICKQFMSFEEAAAKPIEHHTITVNGQEMMLSDYCDENGLNYYNVRRRIMKWGWSVERAISEPEVTGRRHKLVNPAAAATSHTAKLQDHFVTIDGITTPLKEYCTQHGIKYGTAYMRIKRGKTPEEAVGLPVIDKNYSPTKYFVTYGDETQGTLRQYCVDNDLNYKTIVMRIERGGYTLEQALAMPTANRGQNNIKE